MYSNYLQNVWEHSELVCNSLDLLSIPATSSDDQSLPQTVSICTDFNKSEDERKEPHIGIGLTGLETSLAEGTPFLFRKDSIWNRCGWRDHYSLNPKYFQSFPPLPYTCACTGKSTLSLYSMVCVPFIAVRQHVGAVEGSKFSARLWAHTNISGRSEWRAGAWGHL